MIDKSTGNRQARRAEARSLRKHLKVSKSKTQMAKVSIKPEWFESTLVWGCVGIVVSILLAIIGSTVRDCRLGLFFSIPFIFTAAWSISKAKSSKYLLRWTFGSTISWTFIMVLLFHWLPSAQVLGINISGSTFSHDDVGVAVPSGEPLDIKTSTFDHDVKGVEVISK